MVKSRGIETIGKLFRGLLPLLIKAHLSLIMPKRMKKVEPPCNICTRLTSPAAFNSRNPKNFYKLPVRRRREYCEPSRCNAKVGTDLRSELDSRPYNVDRIADKIQDSRRSAQNLDKCSKRDKRKIQQEDVLVSLQDPRIIDLKNVHEAVENCLREMGKIKTFLENENSWWKLLKARSTDCCQQKLPHLHGVLDGSSVTLMLLEEETDQIPRHFVTVRSQKRSDVTDSNFRTSSRELGSEQYTDSWKEHAEEYLDTYTVPYYNLDITSTLIEVASTDGHESTQRYAKRAVTSKQSTVTSEFWTEGQEGRSDEDKIPDRLPRSKEIRDKIQIQDKKKGTDKSKIVPPREIWYGQNNTQTMFEDRLKPRQTHSSENTGSKRLAVTADFESNVDLNTKLSSRNIANHKPRTKTIIEKGINRIQKFPTKILKAKSRD
ncbi:uncharacterized protein LOC112639803 [Camponotus floridanus]|uniref:uncharacterized protein LOC112639803 n=1 Tax=Camponotus floridanus TaxID=104421 RepID=UPI000DC6A500|nr:uncharacterized protein LOC112639803 [Camponotus floridanus]